MKQIEEINGIFDAFMLTSLKLATIKIGLLMTFITKKLQAGIKRSVL